MSVTGSNRGIGLGATAFLAARPDTIVYAGARDVAGATALNELKKQYSGLRPVQLDTTSEKDIKAVAELIKSEEGKIDVVLANAGMCLQSNHRAVRSQSHWSQALLSKRVPSPVHPSN